MGPRRAIAPSDIGKKSELADAQHPSPARCNVAIERTLRAIEKTKGECFCGKCDCIVFGICVRHCDERDKSRADFSDNLLINGDMSAMDALQNDAHGIQ